jgi:hypothetical protein
MKPVLLLLFNHTPTSLQEEDARLSLGIEEIIHLPECLRPVWNSVPPEIEKIEDYLEPIKSWVLESSRTGDYILIQGDFGATYLMVRFAFERGLIPVYSTTRREAIEIHEPQGTVKLSHTFQHVKFRKYGV